MMVVYGMKRCELCGNNILLNIIAGSVRGLRAFSGYPAPGILHSAVFQSAEHTQLFLDCPQKSYIRQTFFV
jgi:hypothetical protein